MNVHNKKTSSIFQTIHNKQIKNKFSKKKVQTLLTYKNLEVKKDFFKKKICADFGCGLTGYGAINLFNLGAEYVHLVDINKNVKKMVKKNLRKYENKYEINISSIEKTNFPNNYFDFILCQGVIHHTKNDRKCFSEIYRTLKPGGSALITVLGQGGLVTDILLKVIRPYYKITKYNKIMRKIIFNQLNSYKKFYFKNLNAKSKKLFNYLNKFIDEDLFLTIQDRILAPKYKVYKENVLRKKFMKMGFYKTYRIKKSPGFNNLRRFLNPFYYHYNHELSRLLYGEGSITLMIKKK